MKQHMSFWIEVAMALFLGVIGCQSTPVVHTMHSTITIPTYEWGPHDVNPRFELSPGMWQTYPYPMQDNLGRTKADKTYKTLVLENEYLRVTVIPELGGHVHSVYDKAAGREMFYVNRVVKPGLIGLCGAWISGGIEFNTGPVAHTVTAVYPVSARFVDYEDGSRSIAVGHVERIYRTQWVAQVRLRPGERRLEIAIHLHNPTPYDQSYYFWNCTAVPNTDGTEFIYPMTLGTDHWYSSFYAWPMNQGKDMTLSRNYDTPTGIFAYECDQDFFGSYDHDLDYGLVAYANHHEVPGKKAWTWGRGDDGLVAMANLTDDGTWYNEIQTGPLQTQNDVGVFGPHQTIAWTEWWYPVHGTDGYEFASRDVAINVLPRVAYNATPKEPPRAIVLSATTAVPDAVCVVSKDDRELGRAKAPLDPRRPTRLELASFLKEPVEAPIQIAVVRGENVLASFIHPLPLPRRSPRPKPGSKTGTAMELYKDGMWDATQGGQPAARDQFEQALAKQPDLPGPMRGLASLDLKAGLYERAARRLDDLLRLTPDDAMAHYLRAEAAFGMDDDRALAGAFKAVRYPETASLGFTLAGQVYIRRGQWTDAVAVLRRAIRRNAEDLTSWNLLAMALLETGHDALAADALRVVLDRDPLDPHAAATLIGWNLNDRYGVVSAERYREIHACLTEDVQTVLEVAARWIRLRQYDLALGALLVGGRDQPGPTPPMFAYYLAYCFDRIKSIDTPPAINAFLAARSTPTDRAEGNDHPLDYAWPHRVEEIDILRAAVDVNPKDAGAWYLLGNVLFARYRYEEGREAWRQAEELGLEYSVLYRNLALAAIHLDKDYEAAAAYYERAHAIDPHDLVVVRDLGRVYTRHLKQWDKALALLESTLAEPRHRSDVTEDLIRAYEHFDRLDDAVALLDTRTFNMWENQDSLHNIYEVVHRRLGDRAMERKDYAAAARSFQRAIEYPRNLGAGKSVKKSQAQLYLLLGDARKAAGDSDAAKAAWQRAADEGSLGGEFAKQAADRLARTP